jgi:YD repeat-containing protein
VQHFAYDSCPNGFGRLCTVSDGTGTPAYSYTPEGWVSGRGFTVGSTSYTLNYSYDAEGHVSAVLYPDDNQASYSYTDGVVPGVTLTMNGKCDHVSLGDLAMSGCTSSNGLTNTLSYDNDGRLTGIAVPGIESLGFGYDKADRITGISNGIDADKGTGAVKLPSNACNLGRSALAGYRLRGRGWCLTTRLFPPSLRFRRTM